MAEDCGMDGIDVIYVAGIRTDQKNHLVGFFRGMGFWVEENEPNFQGQDEFDGRKSAEIYSGRTHIGDIVRSDSEGTGIGPIPEYFLCFNQPIPLPNTTSRMGKYLR